jgi:uncharacterized protein (DUF427 family)
MSAKPTRTPGPDHPITVTPNSARLLATAAGRTIADSTATLTLQEASYPPVHYFPRADVDMSLLEPTAHATYCPYKGDAGYFSVRAGEVVLENAVWTYERPYPAVAEIEEYVAFYPDRVEVREA